MRSYGPRLPIYGGDQRANMENERRRVRTMVRAAQPEHIRRRAQTSRAFSASRQPR
jgi:hypothetical protein